MSVILKKRIWFKMFPTGKSKFFLQYFSFTKEVYYRENDNLLFPTFMDMTGFENDFSKLNRELLNIILKGKLEEKEYLSDVVQFGKKYGEKALRLKYNSRPVYKRIDRIIAVCSCNPFSVLPVYLFDMISEIASNRGKFNMLVRCLRR